MKKYLLFSKVVPRWIIMILDFVIITWSFASSYLIVNRFEFANILRGYFFIYTGIYCIVAALVMYLMRVHTGLIRYSNTRDVLRIFGSVFISSIVYITVITFWVKPFFGINTATIDLVLLVNFSVSSTLLILLRSAVKSAFNYLNNYSSSKKTVVVIYGSDTSAVLVKQALEASAKTNFVIAGFVDTDSSKINKEIQQVRVYDINKLAKLKEKRAIDKMIIMNHHLDEQSKKTALEACLALGIQVLTVPPSDQWIYGKLNMQQIKDLKIEDLLQRKTIQIDTTRISEDLQGKRVLITGAAGSIGSEIVQQVLQYSPAMVILCDQAESPLHDIRLEVEEKFAKVPVKIFIGDIRNYYRMEKLFADYHPEVVYHAAAYKHVPMMEENPSEAVRANVLGTKNIADLSLAYGVRKFVMVSTDKAVNPSNIMGTTKRIAEIYIQSLKDSPANKGTCFITTRFGNVLGSNGSVIPRFRAQIQKGGPITVTHPEITRYFMTIPEAVHLVLEAGTMGSGGEIFIFDMGEPVKIVDLALKMIKLAGLQPDRDIKIVYSGLRPGEKLYEELLNHGENTKPTHHEKIKISEVINYPYQQVAEDIKELLLLNKQNDEMAMVNKMKEIVPEFISKNSKFEHLDNKRELSMKTESSKLRVLQD
ncbi:MULTISPECIES: nucleoside-diphosphate sugar epimerase/dehydratase [unclassified Mucilaginibacter]|uniref:polysaccharide biosynthesis protein n=1 Tax=unclassified Mucilaginibacter TaxID=2617802 RepID=UPI00138B382D|nr:MULTISPECIES: nucleoside-diphosphate sugar epimerase/dehydratase [unclassified Mucilaginibacter]MBB5396040.1 FlaA1/EpsC-like NDP-sugar epimerase [Mucilaginibacter sp. AK015]QHS54261.1 polysaccharide biosynthesis protein [Mucilaginibacter sp. 14171R-50]